MMIDPEQLEVKVIHMDHKRVGEKLPVLYASIPVRELLVKGDILIHVFRIQF